MKSYVDIFSTSDRDIGTFDKENPFKQKYRQTPPDQVDYLKHKQPIPVFFVKRCSSNKE